jgi:hypothetical protein
VTNRTWKQGLLAIPGIAITASQIGVPIMLACLRRIVELRRARLPDAQYILAPVDCLLFARCLGSLGLQGTSAARAWPLTGTPAQYLKALLQ